MTSVQEDVHLVVVCYLAFFFNLKDLSTTIGAAVRANLMLGNHGLAVGAGNEMHAAQGVMGATAIAAAL